MVQFGGLGMNANSVTEVICEV